jgi:hypothetical protein
MNFDYWGFVLPVMPVNKKHYWGVSELTFNDLNELLNLTKEEIEEIGRNGRKWAIENYSPVAVSRRLIDLINNL